MLSYCKRENPGPSHHQIKVSLGKAECQVPETHDRLGSKELATAPKSMSRRLRQPTSQLQLSLVAVPWYRHHQNVEVYTAIELYFHQYPLLGSLWGP